MFTHAELETATRSAGKPKISVFLPTAPHSAQTTDAALHLAGLRKDALALLQQNGMNEQDALALVEPLNRLVNDREFWQHQSHGLAILCNPEGVTTFSCDIELEPQVRVGESFDVLPILAHLTAEGPFYVLALSEAQVTLYRSNRAGLTAMTAEELPQRIDDVLAEDDYQNPMFASPPARPNVGTANISHAQVYGDAPPELKKTLRERYALQVAKAVDQVTKQNPAPTVLFADEELAGLITPRFTFAHVYTTHPVSLSEHELHTLAHAALAEHFDQNRQETLKRFEMQRGRGENVATDVQEVARAAGEGRIESLVVTQTRLDPVISGIVEDTILQGGVVISGHGMDTPPSSGVGALLRYS